MDFETAHAHLMRWYQFGQPSADRDFRSFFEGWLAPQVTAACRRLELGSRDDHLQSLAIYFADRHAAWGAPAKDEPYWKNLINWRLRDILRRTIRMQNQECAHQQAEPGEGDDRIGLLEEAGSSPEQALVDADFDEMCRKAINTELVRLTQVERLAYIVWHWPDSQALANLADFDALSKRSGQTAEDVIALLDAAIPYREDSTEWAQRTVHAFTAADILSTQEGRRTALATYYKMRTRAYARLKTNVVRYLDGGHQ